QPIARPAPPLIRSRGRRPSPLARGVIAALREFPPFESWIRLTSRVIGRSSQSGSPARGWFTLGTIGRVALFSSHLKCQHYYESGHPSGTGIRAARKDQAFGC